MDVRTKFFIRMLILAGIVILLGIFVYIAATDTALENTGEPTTFSPTLINQDEIIGFDSVLPSARNNNDEEKDEEKPIAKITLKDNQKLTDVEIVQETTNDNTVTYTVRMRVSWSEQLHPEWYPAGAHISPMIAWSHRLPNAVFTRGEQASDGMEIMAESGAPKKLVEEIKGLGDLGHILSYSVGKKIYAPGEEMVKIVLSPTAPYATAVSMIAPSPDWFITAHNINLREDGEWLERKTVTAHLYDAGTDNGTTFTAKDDDTKPAGVITSLPSAPKIHLATFEFIRN